MRYRRRYLISWTCNGNNGRDHWVMERNGKLSAADIKRLEKDLSNKWGLSRPVIITNYIQIN
ncbi:agarase [Paenibacillus sp. NAIST15-1]|nr:agarase [Paenibacillus sp. NAIST15-1]